MSRPYSLDLRERVVAAANDGLSLEEAAGHFGVSQSSAARWTRRAAQTGSPAALPMGGRRPFSLEAERAWIAQRFAQTPDLTLRALLAELGQRGIVVSYYALWHIVHRHGLSLKKACTPASSSGLMSCVAGRGGGVTSTGSTPSELLPVRWTRASPARPSRKAVCPPLPCRKITALRSCPDHWNELAGLIVADTDWIVPVLPTNLPTVSVDNRQASDQVSFSRLRHAR